MGYSSLSRTPVRSCRSLDMQDPRRTVVVAFRLAVVVVRLVALRADVEVALARDDVVRVLRLALVAGLAVVRVRARSR